MKAPQTGDWQDEDILHLAATDQNALEKKVKHFLKTLLHSKSANEESPDQVVDHGEFLEKLTEFNDCIRAVCKRKKCRAFISFTLDLFIGHSKIREILLEKRDRFTIRPKLVELFCLLCSGQIDLCKDRENLVDLVLGAYDATLSIEGMSIFSQLLHF